MCAVRFLGPRERHGLASSSSCTSPPRFVLHGEVARCPVRQIFLRWLPFFHISHALGTPVLTIVHHRVLSAVVDVLVLHHECLSYCIPNKHGCVQAIGSQILLHSSFVCQVLQPRLLKALPWPLCNQCVP
jgi:hypothetical protein